MGHDEVMSLKNGKSPRTILNALEEALGATPVRAEMAKLGPVELDQLAGALSEFWRSQAEELIPEGASLIGGWRSAYGSEPSFREDLSDSLLYYPKLLLLDPLANFFDDRSALPEPRGIRYRRRDGVYNVVQAGAAIWSRAGSYDSLREEPGAAANRFASIVDNLYALEEPIRDGVTVLRSQWPILERRRTQLETAVRHDVGSRDLQDFISAIPADQIGVTAWDNLQGLSLSLNDPVRPADEKWRAEPFSYYLNKMLAVADAFGAQYVPASEVDLTFLRRKVVAGVHREHPGAVLREVSRVVVPSLEVPIRQAVAVRKSSDNFEDWRSALRTIQRDAAADSPAELRERVQDVLQPRINKVRHDLENSSLKDLVRTDGADLVIDAALGFSVGFATQEPLWGAAAGVGSGVLQWIRKVYTRPEPSGADAVLATLLRDRK
jgi:hypothetical protein